MPRPTAAVVTGTTAISATESAELVRCLLRVSVFHVAHLRGLFPDEAFQAVNMVNLEGLRIQVLKSTCPASRALVEWVEVGVADALAKRYLARMTFGVAADEACTRLLEEYVFDFGYGDGDGVPSVAIARKEGGGPAGARPRGGGGGGGGAPAPCPRATVASVKHQIVSMIRTLVQVAGTLDAVPADRYLFMKLAYTDDTPPSYEPPRFKPLEGGAAAVAHFPHKPFVLAAGAMATAHHAVGLCVKTALDGVAPPAGGPASQPVASADCEASAMTGTEAAGAGGEEGEEGAAAAAAAAGEVDSPPVAPGVVDAVRGYVSAPGRDEVAFVDVLTRFGSLSVASLKRACDRLVDDGVLRRAPDDDDTFAVVGGGAPAAPQPAAAAPAARRGRARKPLGAVAAAQETAAAAAAKAATSADGGITSAAGTAATASAGGRGRRGARGAAGAPSPPSVGAAAPVHMDGSQASGRAGGVGGCGAKRKASIVEAPIRTQAPPRKTRLSKA